MRNQLLPVFIWNKNNFVLALNQLVNSRLHILITQLIKELIEVFLPAVHFDNKNTELETFFSISMR